MARIITANTLLAKHVTRRDRVLLLNPPVEETRYSWIRWNQPLDLLKIASRLRSRVECGVELLDCMKPDESGKVANDWLPRDRRYYSVKGERYGMRRFGTSYGNLTKQLTSMQRDESGKRRPTQVWITSLCSYWYESVAEVCRIIRQTLPDTQIVLLGQYARLMAKHATEACAADFVVSKPPDLSSEPSAFDLYGYKPPPFLALQLNPNVAVAEVRVAHDRGIQQFTFFEEDVCRDDGEPLREIFDKTKYLRHIRYHFICGLHPAKVTRKVAGVLAHKQVAEAHFEEAEAGSELDVQAYKKVRAYLHEAGLASPDNRLSGFVWIGRPGDQLERIVQRSFEVLNHLEGLILKPYTATPGSPEHRDNDAYLASLLSHREWSPHFFPFAELNGITHGEYHDLYRMAAFLNEKIRDGSFDFLKGTLGAQMLRESLRREVWKLEPSPLRIID